MEANPKIGSLKKPERRLSPLNPFAAIPKGDSDTESPDDRDHLRKRSFGVSMRKTDILEPEKTVSGLRIVRNVLEFDKKPPRSHSNVRTREMSENVKLFDKLNSYKLPILPDSSDQDDIYTDMFVKTTSLPNLPKWSTQQAQYLIDSPSPLYKEKFAHLSSLLTADDIRQYAYEVESSRRTKGFYWKKEAITVWPDWHEDLSTPVRTSPEIKPDNISVISARKNSQAFGSPSLTPLPMPAEGSLVTSPKLSSSNDLLMPDASKPIELNKTPEVNKCSSQTPNIRRLSNRQSFESLGSLGRSRSFGDLSEYLKSYASLKKQLQLEATGFHANLKKILAQLQEFIGPRNAESFPNSTLSLNSSEKSEPQLNLDRRDSKNPMRITKTGSQLSVNVSNMFLDQNSKTFPMMASPQTSPIKDFGPDTIPPPVPHNSLAEEYGDIFIQSLINLAESLQNILDTTIDDLMAPNAVSKITIELQQHRLLWLDNPSWPLHNLMIEILLGFSKIGRIMEHFEEDVRMSQYVTAVNRGKNRKAYNKSSASPRKGSRKFGSNAATSSAADSSDFGDNDDFGDSDFTQYSPPKKFIKPILDIDATKSLDSFQATVDENQNFNILLEVNSGGKLTFISPSAKNVFLVTPEDIVASSTIPFLLEKNKDIFSTLDQGGQNVKFDARKSNGKIIKMEGQGMLAVDSSGNQSGAKIWIIRPAKDRKKSVEDECFPSLISSADDISTNLALCNICDRSVPAISFSRHNTICLDAHKAEMDLVLFTEEVQAQIAACTEKLGLVQEEITFTQKETADEKAVSSHRTQYLVHLENLRSRGSEILEILKKLKFDPMPKLDANSPLTNEDIEWTPWETDLILPTSDTHDSETFIDDGVIEIGVFISKLSSELKELISRRESLLESYQLKFNSYQSCLFKDQNMLWEIETQIGTRIAKKSIPDASDLRFGLQDIGGVFVKVPTLTGLMTGQEMKNESVLFGPTPSGGSAQTSPSSNGQSPTRRVELSELSNAFEDEPVKTKLAPSPLRISVDGVSDYSLGRSSQVSKGNRFFARERQDSDSITSPKTPKSITSVASFAPKRGSLLSPALAPSPALSAASLPSIKDYDIIKPISKGAFGSVYLGKKKSTGDYFAIKVLKKADMVAKNQAMNVKSERIILTQLDSPYVVKLYSTFQSRNHIYLVMEYLRGGDCAALLKSVGQLDEDWARQYISEVVEGLEFLHEKEVVHRDMKPDNLLIDVNGHVKLTDFGLSRVGFIGRRAVGIGDSSLSKHLRSNSPNLLEESPGIRSYMTRRESVASIGASDAQVFGSRLTEKMDSSAGKRMVGTPDYLAPESILGLGQGVSVDWWAVGVILYEFVLGIPPFNAPSPPLVFEKILTGKIEWYEDDTELTDEVKDLISKFLQHDIGSRLGTDGTQGIKNHTWFQETDWGNLINQKVYFVPAVKNIEDTDYFDSRGVKGNTNPKLSDSDEADEVSSGPKSNMEDFGESVLKNLPLLEKANLKVADKLKTDEIQRRGSLSLTSSKSNSFSSRTSAAGLWFHRRRDSLPSSSLKKAGSTGSLSDSESGAFSVGAPINQEALAKKSSSQLYLENAKRSLFESFSTNPDDPDTEIMTALIADANPVTTKILETILKNLKCRSVVARTGIECGQLLLGDIEFDVAFVDLNIPAMSSEQLFRLVRSTNNKNQNMAFILLVNVDEEAFTTSLVRPITKESVLQILSTISNKKSPAPTI